MISEITHTTARGEIGSAARILLVLNVIVVIAGMVLGYIAGTTTSFSCFSVLILVVILDLAIAAAFTRDRKAFDSLNFQLQQDEANPSVDAARYREVVAVAEQYLASNRLSARARDTSSRWPGRLKSRSTAFVLGGTGLTLHVLYRIRATRAIVFALGPVADEHDAVARKLLEGLRQELLRFGENDRPESET